MIFKLKEGITESELRDAIEIDSSGWTSGKKLDKYIIKIEIEEGFKEKYKVLKNKGSILFNEKPNFLNDLIIKTKESNRFQYFVTNTEVIHHSLLHSCVQMIKEIEGLEGESLEDYFLWFNLRTIEDLCKEYDRLCYLLDK